MGTEKQKVVSMNKHKVEKLMGEIDRVRNAMEGKDKEMQILKDVILELKKCNDILLRENMKLKESMGYKTFL